MKRLSINWLEVVALIFGIGASVLRDTVDKRKMDKLISDKVDQAIKEKK